MQGTIQWIHLAPEQSETVRQRDAVDAVAHRGLEGDRYFRDEGTFEDREGSNLTLIEAEALEAVESEYGIDLEPGAHRRNLTTSEIALNHLVNERFRVGDAVCVGMELCEPCSYLESHLEKQGLHDALVHRGGIRARIVESGRIRTGDSIEFL